MLPGMLASVTVSASAVSDAGQDEALGPFGHQHADPPNRLRLLRLGSDRPQEKGEAEEKY